MNPHLHAALQAWGRNDFTQVLCAELPEFATLRIRIRRDTAEATLRVLES
jgi:hypothetical protein